MPTMTRGDRPTEADFTGKEDPGKTRVASRTFELEPRRRPRKPLETQPEAEDTRPPEGESFRRDMTTVFGG